MPAKSEMIGRAILALMAAGLAAGPAASGARDDQARAELGRALAGRVAGAPRSCIDSQNVNGPQIIGDRTLLYRQSGWRVWVTTLPDACPFLNDNVIVVAEVYGTQLCSSNRFRTITRYTSIPSGICRFGQFVPYDKPPRAKTSG